MTYRPTPSRSPRIGRTRCTGDSISRCDFLRRYFVFFFFAPRRTTRFRRNVKSCDAIPPHDPSGMCRNRLSFVDPFHLEFCKRRPPSFSPRIFNFSPLARFCDCFSFFLFLFSLHRKQSITLGTRRIHAVWCQVYVSPLRILRVHARDDDEYTAIFSQRARSRSYQRTDRRYPANATQVCGSRAVLAEFYGRSFRSSGVNRFRPSRNPWQLEQLNKPRVPRVSFQVFSQGIVVLKS